MLSDCNAIGRELESWQIKHYLNLQFKKVMGSDEICKYLPANIVCLMLICFPLWLLIVLIIQLRHCGEFVLYSSLLCLVVLKACEFYHYSKWAILPLLLRTALCVQLYSYCLVWQLVV